MKGCRLSDDSLRALTLPISMSAKGPAGLLMLDISHNPAISRRSLPKIKVLRQLQKIAVEGTGLAEGGRSLIEPLKALGLKDLPTICVVNNGWINDCGLWSRWSKLFSTLEGLPPSKRLRLR